MTYRTPSIKDPYGLFYLSLSSDPSFDNYYRSLDILTPCLRAADWVGSCTGFYVNSVDGGLPRRSCGGCGRSAG